MRKYPAALPPSTDRSVVPPQRGGNRRPAADRWLDGSGPRQVQGQRSTFWCLISFRGAP